MPTEPVIVVVCREGQHTCMVSFTPSRYGSAMYALARHALLHRVISPACALQAVAHVRRQVKAFRAQQGGRA